MLDDGERLVPGFREARALRVWAGVRPLFQDEKAGDGRPTRATSAARTRCVDHRRARRRRRPAHDVGRQAHDAAADGAGPRRRDVRAARRRAAVPHRRGAAARQRGRRALPASARACARREATLQDEQLICECELIGRGAGSRSAMRRARHDEPRRHPPQPAARHGPVPGRLLHLPRDRASCTASSASTAREAAASLRDFLQERWKGVWPILYGDQLRQARLDDWIFQGLLDVEHLPSAAPTPSSEAGRREPLRRHRRRHRAGRADRRRAARRGAARACSCSPRASARRTWRRATIDVLGYAPERVERPRRGARPALAAQPGHPYARSAPTASARRVAWFKDRVAGGPLAPYAYAGGLDENLLLPTAVGAPRRRRSCRRRWPAATCAAAAAVCVVGFRALKDFHPALLRRQPRAAPGRRGARGIELDLVPERPRRRQRARVRARASTIRRSAARSPRSCAARLGGDERVALPGRARHRATRTASGRSSSTGSAARCSRSRRCRRRCPGMRVFAILRDALRRAGGRGRPQQRR